MVRRSAATILGMSVALHWSIAVTGAAAIVDDGSGSLGAHANCSSSAAAALTRPCRDPTLSEADNQISSHLQRLFKASSSSHADDPLQQRAIEKSTGAMRELFSRGVEISDDAGLFDHALIDNDTITPQSLIDAIVSSPVMHAGCNFTLQRSGVVPFARSFLVAYPVDSAWKLAAIHVGIENPEHLNAEPPSARRVKLSSIKTRMVVPGYKNSNALLRTHIVLQATKQCQSGILSKLDPAYLRALQLEASNLSRNAK
ncbi:MAG: hypothetical protein AAF141_14410 [Pseudomonadota bacterium]